MIRFLFVCVTIVVGVLMQIVLGRYLSLYDAAPQVFLLLTITHGFVFGPVLGEILGFSWGLISDATGIRLFGLNALLLALAGYLAGKLRRRVASERMTAQVIISLVATLYYMIGVSTLYSIFDESPGRFSVTHFIIEAIYNGVFAVAFFMFTERWTALWGIQSEHI